MKLDPKVQERIDAETRALREKLEAEAIAKAEAERARAKPADVIDLWAVKSQMDRIERLISGGLPIPLPVTTARAPARRRSRAASTRELPTEGDIKAAESYEGTAIVEIRALMELLGGVIRVPDIIDHKIMNHLGKPVTASNARRFLEKLEASGEAFCGKEVRRHIPGPGWRFVWAKTPKLLAEAIAGKHPRAGEGKDGVNKA